MGYRWIKGLICSILIFLPAMLAAQHSGPHLVIVKSSDNAYFNETVETLINHIDPAAHFRIVLASELADKFRSEDKDALFVALGQSAVQAVNSQHQRVDSINAYLTLEQYRQLGLSHQVTVLLDQPMRRYLAFSKHMLSASSVGILVQQNLDLEQTESDLLNQLDFDLKQYRIDSENKLLPQLRKLLRQNDTLLMLPRQSIYNRDSLKGVLLTSYRSRKPVISYSPAHVKSGALASIYSSPVDIGRHLSLLVNQKLLDPSQRGAPFRYARFYSIATNQRVARSLGLSLPDEDDLRSTLDRTAP